METNTEYQKKLQDLKNREINIRKEREKIQASRPWYLRIQNLISVLAILIPIFASIIFKIVDESKKELTIEFNESEKLLTSTKLSNKNISVNYDSLKIQNISSLKIILKNTGDIPIRKADFLDGPIRFTIKDRVQKDSNKLPFLLNVFKIDDANQQNSELKIIEQKSTCEFAYLPSLLNPGDKVEIGILLSNEPNVRLNWAGKIDNGDIQFQQLVANDNNIQTNNFAKTILNVFKSKAISIPLIIAVFFILLIFNILLWNRMSTGELESDPPLFGYTLLLGFTIFSIFTLIFFIALVI